MRTSVWSHVLMEQAWAGLNADRRCHLLPALVLLTFEAPQIGGRHSQAAVVQEPRHVLNGIASVAPELGGAVAEDMNATMLKASFLEVPAEVGVEGRAGDTAAG